MCFNRVYLDFNLQYFMLECQDVVDKLISNSSRCVNKTRLPLQKYDTCLTLTKHQTCLVYVIRNSLYS